MTTLSPKVTVIMNCFNGDRFLAEAIDSVYQQTFTDWEIVFWDNASSDRSGEIANLYDEKLRYFCAEETTDLGVARIKAVEQAKGKYLAFLDVDDIWLADKLQRQMELFKSGGDDLGLVYGRCEFFYSNKDKESYILRYGEKLPTGQVFSEIVMDNFIPFVSAVVEKKKYYECGGFPQHQKHSTDYWLFSHMAYRYKVDAVQDVCCRYRIHENNLTNFLTVTAATESIDIVSSFLPDKTAQNGLRYQQVKLAFAYIKNGNILKSITVVLQNHIYLLFLKQLTKRILGSV